MMILKQIFYYGPLLFAFGFIAPLTAQIIERAGWTPPLDLSPLAVGLVLAAVWGTSAQIRGTWI